MLTHIIGWIYNTYLYIILIIFLAAAITLDPGGWVVKEGEGIPFPFFSFFFFAEIDIIMCIENDFLVMGIFFKLQN